MIETVMTVHSKKLFIWQGDEVTFASRHVHLLQRFSTCGSWPSRGSPDDLLGVGWDHQKFSNLL